VEDSKIVSWATYLTPREAVRAAKELLGGSLEQTQAKRTARPAAAPQRPPASAEAQSPVPAEAQPPATVEHAAPALADASSDERPRKRALTKSEEQKRAAKARAKLRRRASQQTA
jgi:hypothetical protein